MAVARFHDPVAKPLHNHKAAASRGVGYRTQQASKTGEGGRVLFRLVANGAGAARRFPVKGIRTR